MSDDTKPPRPHRAYELDIHIGADTWKEAMWELTELANHIKDHGEKCSSVSGSPSGNHTVTIAVRPEMTHERYFKELDAYLDARPKQAPTEGVQKA